MRGFGASPTASLAEPLARFEGFEGFEATSMAEPLARFEGFEGLRGLRGSRGLRGLRGFEGFEGLEGFEAFEGQFRATRKKKDLARQSPEPTVCATPPTVSHSLPWWHFRCQTLALNP